MRGMSDRSLSFGPFELFPQRRALLEGGKPLRLGSRALEVLIVLVEHAGELLSNKDLLARAWPDTFVEEANLRVQVMALRKSLGDGQGSARYIKNVPGRGYCFVAPVVAYGQPKTGDQPAGEDIESSLPVLLTRLIGREKEVSALVDRLSQRRFVTIVGAPGIGKTSVAVAVARHLVGEYKNGVHFVELASVSDPALVPSAVATALGLPIWSEASTPGVVEFVRDRHILIVLDNCEHVLDAASELTVALLKGGSRTHVLTTSREPLRADGEWLYRLPTLAAPPPNEALTAARAFTFPAVQLFVERALAALDSFDLTDANAAIVAVLCRQLGGIPLAIELAASRIDVFGAAELAADLHNGLRLLQRGRRTAVPRHQTLRAALNWSFELLSHGEQTILARLSVFRSPFDMEAAVAVVADDTISRANVIDGIADLTAKSLVAANASDPTTCFYLLETTRAYAAEKLVEPAPVARRHAEYFAAFFERAEADLETGPMPVFLEAYSRRIDDVRSALDWAFSADGDGAVGVALTVASAPIWVRLSLFPLFFLWGDVALLVEFKGRLERAFQFLSQMSKPNLRQRMKLNAALGVAILNTNGSTSHMGEAFRKALVIAEDVGDLSFQMKALWGLFIERSVVGDYAVAATIARRFAAVAERLSLPISVGDGLLGLALHHGGEHAEARLHVERAIRIARVTPQVPRSSDYGYDDRTAAGTQLSRILWIQGFADQATEAARDVIADAVSQDHSPSVCFALAMAACPIAFWIGDRHASRRYVDVLLEHSNKNSLCFWRGWGRSFDIIWEGRHSAARAPAPGILRGAAVSTTLLLDLLSTLSEEFVTSAAVARAEQGLSGWCAAETLRATAEILLKGDGPDRMISADALFRRSLELARAQGARAWELRTATSWARFHHNQKRSSEAYELLAPVLDRFTEGFATTDLLAASALRAELQS
jgi:predicted ATPase/DNA-binding winged helix-turn-helix (wHTH) protein